jgi:hypothetical protein
MKGILIHVGKTISIVILLIGFIVFLLTIVFAVYEIITNIHKGFIELSDSTRGFILWTLIFSAITVLIGLIGLMKSNEAIEKRAKKLRKLLELE